MGDGAVLPGDFGFGVATAGFQIEGGYNGPGEPANNWAAWERSGRVEQSGIAFDFWNRYEEQLDRVRGVRWSDRDTMGGDSAAAYRRIISGLRNGDRSVLA